MDCGEGAQKSFVERGLGMNKATAILITHLHGDHVNGLLGLLQTMSMSQRTRALVLVAPRELRGWLRDTMKVLNIGLTFDLEFVQARPGVVLRRDGYRIRCARATHSVDAWSYLFEETPRPGVFDSMRAVALGVPEGRKWSALQHGRSVVVGGRKVRPGEVMGPRRAGRRVGYSGDTRPSGTLVRLFAGADLVIFDSTFATRDADKARERMHSTSAEAAALAKRAGAKRLVLTHFSARYRNVRQLVREAAAVFPNTVAAHDGLVIEVPAAQ